MLLAGARVLRLLLLLVVCRGVNVKLPRSVASFPSMDVLTPIPANLPATSHRVPILILVPLNRGLSRLAPKPALLRNVAVLTSLLERSPSQSFQLETLLPLLLRLLLLRSRNSRKRDAQPRLPEVHTAPRLLVARKVQAAPPMPPRLIVDRARIGRGPRALALAPLRIRDGRVALTGVRVVARRRRRQRRVERGRTSMCRRARGRVDGESRFPVFFSFWATPL